MHTPTSLQSMKKNAAKAAAMLSMLSNAKRLMILCYISREDVTVNDLAQKVGLSQSALSQHLAKMRADKLVKGERRGQAVYYRIARPEVEALLATLYLIYCHP